MPSDNPFLDEYRLASPVNAFGHATSNIAFTATGPMAVLDDVSPEALANSLGLTVGLANAGKFMAEKVIVDTRDIEAGTTFSTYVTLNVSNVDTHPGKTLAGCSYKLEVRRRIGYAAHKKPGVFSAGLSDVSVDHAV